MKLLATIIIATISALSQTPIDAIINLSAPSPGTTLTPTILSNGTSGVIGSYSIVGTGSSLTVGNHSSLCDLNVSVSLSGVPYSGSSQPISLNNTSSFTYVETSSSVTTAKITISGCIMFGGNTVTTNLMDQIAVLGIIGGGAFLQQDTAGHIRIESVFGSTHQSSNITPGGANPTLWCSFSVDPTTPFSGVSNSGTASLACFLPYAPFTQVGSTVSVDIQNAAGFGNIGTIRIGNAEVGTAAGTVTTFENLIFDSNAVFPLTQTALISVFTMSGKIMLSGKVN